jgi:hypothetical protein
MLRLGSTARAILHAFASAGVLASSFWSAQQNQTPVYTLKVSADLVQVPTLVLDRHMQPLPPIPRDRFRVSLDGGRKFTPSQVRMEGGDPLDIAILIDLHSQPMLIRSFADAAAKLQRASLHSNDRVSIYALDCDLSGWSPQGAVEAEAVSAAVRALLTASRLEALKYPNKCAARPAVSDAMVTVLKRMSASPARRVLLLLSSQLPPGLVGLDHLARYAGAQGVAVFAMDDTPAGMQDVSRGFRADPLRTFCEATGGMVLHTEDRDLSQRLEQWVELLRSRYVIQFPLPQRLKTGLHDIQISIPGERDFVRASGVSFSLPDPALTSDPHYLPPKQGADIPVGTRRPSPD